MSQVPDKSLASQATTRPEAKPKSFRYLLGVFAGGNALSMVLRWASGLLTGRVVGPETLGLFNGISLVLGWSQFLQLGVMNGLNRELPYHHARGDHKRMQELGSAAQAWATLLGVLMAGALSLVAIYYAVQGDWKYAAAWAVNAIGGWCVFYAGGYLEITFRTHSDFARLSLINLVQSALHLALVGAVLWLSFYGLCLRSAIVSVVQFALMRHWRPLRLKSVWNWRHLKHLCMIGFPIFVVGQIYDWWTLLNSTLVLKHTGIRGLGLYGVAMMGSGALQLLPDAMRQILYPRLVEMHGRSMPIYELCIQAVRKTAVLCACFTPVLVVSWFLVEPTLRVLLPKYVAAAPVAQWALLLPAASCVSPVCIIFNVVRRQRLYLLCILAGMGAYCGILKWLLASAWGLVAFPAAMVAGRFVMVLLSFAAIVWLIIEEKQGCGSARAKDS